MLTVEQANMKLMSEPRTDGADLVLEVVSDDRDSLVELGRQFVVDWLQKSPTYNSWAMSGVDRASGPVCFDPEQPDADPYTVTRNAGEKAKDIKWKFRQAFRITKMI